MLSLHNFYILIIFLPFYSAFICGFFGRLIGRWVSIFVSIGCLSVAAFLAWHKLMLGGDATTEVNFGLWCFLLNNISLTFVLYIATSVMLVVVATISLFLHIYSVSYMRYYPHIIIFFCYLSLFTFFMLMLVTSCSLIALFIVL